MSVPSSGSIINNQDLYDGFNYWFVQFANAGITYGTNSYHFPDMPPEFIAGYGGSTSGIPLRSQRDYAIDTDRTIDDGGIRDYIIGQAVTYCRIRNVSITRTVTASGRRSGVDLLPIVETRTGITNLTTNFAAPGFSNPSSINNIIVNNIIYADQLNQFMYDCWTRYLNNQRNNTLSVPYSVCHNSCHSSCHGSRSRR